MKLQALSCFSRASTWWDYWTSSTCSSEEWELPSSQLCLPHSTLQVTQVAKLVGEVTFPFKLNIPVCSLHLNQEKSSQLLWSRDMSPRSCPCVSFSEHKPQHCELVHISLQQWQAALAICPVSQGKSSAGLDLLLLPGLLPHRNLRNVFCNFHHCSESTSFLSRMSEVLQHKNHSRTRLNNERSPPPHWWVILSLKSIEFRADYSLLYHSSHSCQLLCQTAFTKSHCAVGRFCFSSWNNP